MAIEIRTQVQRRDRWVNWIVVGIFVVALLCGWILKTAAEGRSTLYEAEGVRVRYPIGWYRLTEVEPPLLLQVEDRGVEPFRTTLILQRRPLPAYERPLGIVRQDLAMERAMDPAQWENYRVLDTEEAFSVCEQAGVLVSFAYVEADPNPLFVTPPLVMRGEDILLVGENGVYAFTLTAAEENFVRAQERLRDFVCSFEE